MANGSTMNHLWVDIQDHAPAEYHSVAAKSASRKPHRSNSELDRRERLLSGVRKTPAVTPRMV